MMNGGEEMKFIDNYPLRIFILIPHSVGVLPWISIVAGSRLIHSTVFDRDSEH